MARRTEAPVSRPDPMTPGDDNVKSTHPSFGQISVSKVQGRNVMFGSDFVHHNFVSLRVHTAEHNRNLSHDWVFPRECVLELNMSEAQWATFVSSFNTQGVPCTLRYVRGDDDTRPSLPDPDLRREFSDEVLRTMNDSIDRLHALQDKVRNSTMGKGLQKEISTAIMMAIQEIESNVPFIKESFDKHVETSVEKAKVEVNAYMTNQIMRAGLEKLGADQDLLEYRPDAKEG